MVRGAHGRAVRTRYCARYLVVLTNVTDVYLNEEDVLVFWQARNAKNKPRPRVIQRFTEGKSFVRYEDHYNPAL